MKVLFAVNSESISDAIIKKYQKDYREILSYKNVYYFNAIQKEIQKDKSYDRIVISEDLEPFSNNNYESIDKFIFEKLDSISDEAHDTQGREISIILICSDRHTKGSSFLVKLFGIGVYNALLGNDRSMEEVCRLINKPRTKKEAKMYYKIDTDDVKYSSESENEVSELEIQNIISHFKKLGKNSAKYASSFENIASQYTEEQLKIIINCLPINVKAALEETSEKYQEIMAKSGVMVQGVRSTSANAMQDQRRTGVKIDIIENKLNQTKMTKPIVIPNSVKTTKSTNARKVIAVPQNAQMANEMKKQSANKVKPSENMQHKVVKKAPTVSNDKEDSAGTVIPKKKVVSKEQLVNGKVVKKIPVQGTVNNMESSAKKKVVSAKASEEVKTVKPVRKSVNIPEKKLNIQETEKFDELDDLELVDFDTQSNVKENVLNEETPKKRRGRPRKNPIPTEPKAKGKRGRPRKNDIVEYDDEDELPDLETITQEQLDFDSFDEENEDVLYNSASEEFNDFIDIEDETSENEEIEDNDDVLLPELDDLEDIDDEEDDDGFLSDFDEEPFDEFDEYDEYGQEIPEPKSELDDVDELYNEDILEENDDDTDDLLSGLDFDEDTDVEDDVSYDEDDDFEEVSDDENISFDEDSEESDDDSDMLLSDFDDDTDDLLAGLDFEDDEEDNVSEVSEELEDDIQEEVVDDLFDDEPQMNYNDSVSDYQSDALESIKSPIDYSMSNLNSLMTKDKKIVTFLGSPKNGVSFLVNNLAEIFASVGINTAILDMTKNKNSYYIYTQNDENLRKIAYTSIENLQRGTAEGIRVKQNLTVYTALPNDGKDYSNAEPILSTLVQEHSLILIDCDFDTNPSYFASSQEIYLVQSMDILTIQPLTAFLRELTTQGVLEPEKVKVVINKELKVKGLTNKAIIGGMSFYNDPAMSFMTELFNKDNVKYCSIPFEEMAYSKYLEAILNCKVSINGYSKNFMNKLRVLADMVYPLTSRQTYTPNRSQNYDRPQQSNFSSSMNNTLNKMKKKY